MRSPISHPKVGFEGIRSLNPTKLPVPFSSTKYTRTYAIPISSFSREELSRLGSCGPQCPTPTMGRVWARSRWHAVAELLIGPTSNRFFYVLGSITFKQPTRATTLQQVISTTVSRRHLHTFVVVVTRRCDRRKRQCFLAVWQQLRRF